MSCNTCYPTKQSALECRARLVRLERLAGRMTRFNVYQCALHENLTWHVGRDRGLDRNQRTRANQRRM